MKVLHGIRRWTEVLSQLRILAVMFPGDRCMHGTVQGPTDLRRISIT